MENKQSNGIVSGLVILKWAFLIFLILVTFWFILFGIGVYDMLSRMMSEIIQCIDSGDFNKIGSIDRKGIAVNHHFLFYSFMISVCSLTAIIIILCISLRITKKKLKLIHNQAPAADAKDPAAEAQRSASSERE